MIQIKGVQIDPTRGPKSLSSTNAVFVMEFEYDSRVMVCHTLSAPVYNAISGIVERVLNAKDRDLKVLRALLNSQYLSVEVVASDLKNKAEVMAKKYEFVERYKSYDPYGYNTLNPRDLLERDCASSLFHKLEEEIRRTALCAPAPSDAPSPGRRAHAVYCYDIKTGERIRGYKSIREAADSVGAHSSNISMCCTGRLKSTGGFVWSYRDIPAVDVTGLRDRRVRRKPLPPDPQELEKRRQRFIDKCKYLYNG